MLRRLLLRLGLILPFCLGRAQADSLESDEHVAFHFETSSSRLVANQAAAFAQIQTRLRGSSGIKLIVLIPPTNNPGRARFQMARAAELDRQLQLLGLSAERQIAAKTEDEDLLFVALHRDSIPKKNLPLVTAVDPPPAVSVPIELSPPNNWTASSGQFLRGVLQEWGARAGWTILWQSDVDYPLDASATLSGDFVTATTALLSGFKDAAPPPSVKFFMSNQVVVVH